MIALSLWVATKSGLWQIIVAGLTLLPGPIAYAVYGVILDAQKERPIPTRAKRLLRVAGHVLIALFAVFFLHAAADRCPVDDDGYCADENWKPPSASHTAANDMRVAILIFGGMLFASDRRRKRDPEI